MFAAHAEQLHQIDVLTGTVTTSTTGPWSALGLLRNDRLAQDCTGVGVSAALYDASNSLLETVTATVALRIRPGEPAPFSLAGNTPAPTVAKVVYGTTSGTCAAPQDRSIQFTAGLSLPPGLRDPIVYSSYSEQAGVSEPLLASGTIVNTGSTIIASPTATVAWLDDSGRVVRIATAAAVDNGGAVVASLAPGDQANVWLTVAGANSSGGCVTLLLTVSGRVLRRGFSTCVVGGAGR